MDFEEFKTKVAEVKMQKPKCFSLPSDPKACHSDIEKAEHLLGTKLPPAYRAFVYEYGGGFFAQGNVFSVYPGSEWNIVDRNTPAIVPGFVAVSDIGTGDVFGFRIVDGRCEDRVVKTVHDQKGAISETMYRDLLQFLEVFALR